MIRKCTMNAETRPCTFIPRGLKQLLDVRKLPLDQKFKHEYFKQVFHIRIRGNLPIWMSDAKINLPGWVIFGGKTGFFFIFPPCDCFCTHQTGQVFWKITCLLAVATHPVCDLGECYMKLCKLYPLCKQQPSCETLCLSKIHWENIPFIAVVSACGTSTYKLARFLTNILQLYCGNNFSYVKDSKGLTKFLKEQKVAPRWDFGILWCQSPFSCIPVAVAVEVKNRKFT